MKTKGTGYQRWATVYNLKQMSETFLFMREHHVESFEDLYRMTDEAVSKFNDLNGQIKSAEAAMAANLAMQKHIQNYARTKPVYDEYRKSGYSKKFFEAHREELTLHKAAKQAFNEAKKGGQPHRTLKELRRDYANLISEKKKLYPEYRKAKRQMQEFLKARQNVEMFYGDELKKGREEERRRAEEQEKNQNR